MRKVRGSVPWEVNVLVIPGVEQIAALGSEDTLRDHLLVCEGRARAWPSWAAA